MEVPLVWNHQHDSISNVLGKCLLKNKERGVYGYGSFNDSPAGQDAKEALRHGDIVALSIYANQLKQKGGDVLHGNIREVSLVLAGANPGALIENVTLAHGENFPEDEAVIYTGMPLSLYHADTDEDEDDLEMAIAAPSATFSSEVHFHKVKKGETLQSIARKCHTTVDALCKLNRIGKSIRLMPGQILKYN